MFILLVDSIEVNKNKEYFMYNSTSTLYILCKC